MHIFKEARLPESFASDITEKVEHLIAEGQSFSIIGMNSIGVSPFLRYIASRNIAHFIYIDMYELPKFTKEDFLTMLYERISGMKMPSPTFHDCKDALEKLLKEHNRIVIILNKFDLLAKEFSFEFLGNVRTLVHVTDGRVSLMMSINRPYIVINPSAISGSNMHIFSRYVHFHPYAKNDVIEMMKLHSPENLDSPRLDHALELSNGHMQLLQLILRSETPTELLEDPYIRLLFKEILSDLTPAQNRIIKRIAEGKSTEQDLYLENIGIVVKEDNQYSLFNPLLQGYIAKKQAMKLSKKEQLLLNYMKKNIGKIMPTEKIVDAVWGEEAGNATNWALDSLIYRLRRHPMLKEKGFSIVSHKKLGYQLVKGALL